MMRPPVFTCLFGYRTSARHDFFEVSPLMSVLPPSHVRATSDGIVVY